MWGVVGESKFRPFLVEKKWMAKIAIRKIEARKSFNRYFEAGLAECAGRGEALESVEFSSFGLARFVPRKGAAD